MAEIRDAERLLRNADGLNHRQVALLTHALRHPDASYTLEGHRASHQVVYETARQDVYGFVARGLLESQRRGRALHFFPVRDFESRLRKLR